MTATLPKRISATWLRQRRGTLGCTAKTLGNGEPNPSYVNQAAELAEAEAEFARREAFEAWVKQTMGAVLNQYPLRADKTYEPGKVFLKKDKETGRITFWTVEQCWEKYEAAQA